MKIDERARKVEAAIRLSYSSLASHLQYTYGKVPKGESRAFHKRCVKEYATIIKLLSELY